MSMKSAKEYIELMKNDNDFSSRVVACKDAKERMAMVTAEGFEFSSKEINSLKSELTDDEFWRTIFHENAGGYDSPDGHGQDR